MIRSKSNISVSIASLLQLSEASFKSPRGSTYYEADKGADVSHLKLYKRYILWIRHKTAALVASRRRMLQLLLLVLLLVMAVAGVLVLHLYKAFQGPVHHTQHMVIMDAGSTGTRVHVFRYRAHPSSAYPLIHLPEAKLKLQPGLSTFAENPMGAEEPLKNLLEYAAAHVPSDEWQVTPVFLMATAGLRLLPAQQADALLAHCRGVLARSPFRFDHSWVTIITGQEEGLYGWVAANYAAGSLQAAAKHVGSRRDPAERRRFHGLLEMGGASTQLTLMPDRALPSPSRRHSLRVALPGVDRPLFSHSFLGYGFDVLEQKVEALHAHSQAASPAASRDSTSDPCLPNGYTNAQGRHGKGDWTVCQHLVSQIMDPAFCRVRANSSSDCPEVPSALPNLHGPLVAIENFYYTAHALQLPPHASPLELSGAAASFCSRPWQQTLAIHGVLDTEKHLLHRYCYGAAVVFTLLQDVLKVPAHTKLHFTNTLQQPGGPDVGLDWALGAAVVHLAAQQSLLHPLLLQAERALLFGCGVLLVLLVVRYVWPAGFGSGAQDGTATEASILLKQ